MPKFSYVAMDKQGKESKGTLEVGSQNEAISRVKDMGLFPTKIVEVDKSKEKPDKQSKSGAKPAANTTRTIIVAGRGGVPTTGAAAVAVTITGTQPDDLGYLTAWPTGPRPNTSNLNLTPGQTAANVAIVPLAPDGTIQLYTSGQTHILIDVIAWIPN